MLRHLQAVAAITLLFLVLPRRADAEKLTTARDQIIVGLVVVGAAAGAGITLLVLHEKHKNSRITGCVASGMTLTNDKDKRTYTLAGATASIKAGDRMTLEGKRQKSGNDPAFEVRAVVKDLGVCRR